MSNYNPPFNITNKTLNYISKIMEKVGKIDNYDGFSRAPILRRNNRIKSIYSSLAIEANSLSFEQVKDVVSGKTVIGPQNEIQEVKNAYNAYELAEKVDPYSIKDLEKIHGIMTYLTVRESGKFRSGNEGVFDEKGNCIHVCPPPEQVYGLMHQLFGWLKENKEKIHPLILSSVFHYEILFIHPFSDGNGRTARLWQNVLLLNWKKIFEYVPIESQIKKYQDDYYKAIDNCNKSGESTEFIEFMLKMFDEVLEEMLVTSPIATMELNININKLLDVMEPNTPMTANSIMKKIGIKSKETLRSTYLDPAIREGVVALTIPDKPTSKNQMYYRVYNAKHNK